MSASAEHGALTSPPQPPHRRAFCAAVAGSLLASGVAWPSRALAGDPTPPPLALVQDDDLRLLTNLMTRLATPTSVNGRDVWRFVLDTGAERTAIADNVAAEMALPPGPAVMLHGITAAERVATVRIASLAFGGVRFDDIIAPVLPRGRLGADGLLGLDVLSRFELAFNLADNTARLTPSGERPTVRRSGSGATRLERPDRDRSDQAGQILLIATRAEGRPVQAFIDSGAQYSIGNMALHRATYGGASSALKADMAAPVQVPVYGVTGQMLLAETGVLRELEIDGKRLGPTPMLFADLYAFRKLDLIDRPALLIGADVLYRFQGVSLDFARARVGFSGLRRRPPVAAG